MGVRSYCRILKRHVDHFYGTVVERQNTIFYHDIPESDCTRFYQIRISVSECCDVVVNVPRRTTNPRYPVHPFKRQRLIPYIDQLVVAQGVEIRTAVGSVNLDDVSVVELVQDVADGPARYFPGGAATLRVDPAVGHVPCCTINHCNNKQQQTV